MTETASFNCFVISAVVFIDVVFYMERILPAIPPARIDGGTDGMTLSSIRLA